MYLFVGSAASPTFLPFHRPPTLPPKNAANAPHFPPPRYIRARRQRTRSREEAAGGSGSLRLHFPPPIFSDRGRLPAEDADRAPAAQRPDAVCRFVQLAATVSSGFHHLSNKLLVVYLRFTFFKL